jgi:16S rRNA (cytidine1402-2'-O)-methyltransferase
MVLDLKGEGKKRFGLCSDAGCPGIGDPGAEVVKLFHRKTWEVEPIVGPSSIFLALMSSGFNGQSFSFEGYLPIETAERRKKLRQIEEQVLKTNKTSIWIETPYRNNALIKEMLQTLKPETHICFAVDLLFKDQIILRDSVSAMSKRKDLDLNKRQVVFLLGQQK